MSRSDIEHEITQTLGQVPSFFQAMPDETLEHEWAEFKRFQLEDTELSVREKELIGFGVAAATHCPYCTYFHRRSAQMAGASDAQIEEAARVAMDTVKYSTYLHALETDLDEFKRTADEIGEYVSSRAQVTDGYQPGEESSPQESRTEGASSLEETMKDIREQAA